MRTRAQNGIEGIDPHFGDIDTGVGPIEELEEVILDPANPTKCAYVGKNLDEQLK